MLAATTLLALASAIASGLSDEESDRAGGKRTFATLLGNARARRASVALLVAGGALLAAAPILDPTGPGPLAAVPAAAVVLARAPAARRLAGAATTNAFAAQASFKAVLHAAIWRGTFALAALVVAPLAQRLMWSSR